MAGKRIKYFIDKSKTALTQVQKLNVSLPSLRRKRHPATHCLNCQLQFDIETNYCPRCGQENNHNQLSFWTIATDFLHNYFSLDSQFGNSIHPFLLRPGALTNYYTEGKRAAFINPIRLYLIVSLLFFFVFSLLSQDFVVKTQNRLEQTNQNLRDSVSMDINQIFMVKLDSIHQIKEDSIARLHEQDTVRAWTGRSAESENEFLTQETVKTYLSLREDRNLSPHQIMDSLNTEVLSELEKKIVYQVIKMDQMSMDMVMNRILQNIPVMMMILLPLLALIFKLFYLKKDIYYFSHLIHLVHLHSFTYFIFAIGAILVLNHEMLPLHYSVVWRCCFFLVTIYGILSFKKVYGEHWARTVFKYLSIGLLYLFLLVIAGVMELFITVFNL
ncbi:DUF3667 domain-containing protein [Reichenbachiella sp. 5M10]|uniref:DUF3667 domain-containing protein n=1 Tax=Reichenbachiella sp. 5M10 TaxID=1889772 RepID=UPI0013042314|nr:DUF3667 domain-containing protein [Reichenbachiella sp. 5M10]